MGSDLADPVARTARWSPMDGFTACMDSSSIASTLFDRSQGTTAYVYPVS